MSMGIGIIIGSALANSTQGMSTHQAIALVIGMGLGVVVSWFIIWRIVR